MKGVLLAGGTGSRLMPLTKATNKALLPLGRRTIVEHVLATLTLGGCDDVMIVSGPEHFGQLAQLLGSGKDHGCRLTYRVQDEAGGIAQALALCEDFAGGERFAVVLGDNVFEDRVEPARAILDFAQHDCDYRFLVKEMDDASRFGVVRYDDARCRAVEIVEKPIVAPSRDAVLGLYLYSPKVWKRLREVMTAPPSARGEYEISAVNSAMIATTSGGIHRIRCGWIDTGTHESYQAACEMVRRSGR